MNICMYIYIYVYIYINVNFTPNVTKFCYLLMLLLFALNSSSSSGCKHNRYVYNIDSSYRLHKYMPPKTLDPCSSTVVAHTIHLPSSPYLQVLCGCLRMCLCVCVCVERRVECGVGFFKPRRSIHLISNICNFNPYAAAASLRFALL